MDVSASSVAANDQQDDEFEDGIFDDDEFEEKFNISMYLYFNQFETICKYANMRIETSAMVAKYQAHLDELGALIRFGEHLETECLFYPIRLI